MEMVDGLKSALQHSSMGKAPILRENQWENA